MSFRLSDSDYRKVVRMASFFAYTYGMAERADDIAHDVILRLRSKLKGQSLSKLKPYISKAILNHIKTLRQQRRPVADSESVTFHSIDAVRIEDLERRMDFFERFATLPSLDRTMVHLRAEGMTTDEIAIVVNRSRTYVSHRLPQVIRWLRNA